MLKLGKKPAAPRYTDFSFGALAADVALPSAPSRFGHGTLFSDWWMLGNDYYGDCVWAGAAHEHRMIHKVIHRTDLLFDDDHVLADYAAVTGFNKNDPSTDQGTDVHEALAYRRKTGIADANAARHMIGAYLALDPKNWDHLRVATYIFGAVGIGFEFPDYAMDQFNNGQPWDVQPGGHIEGGHYVPVVGAPSGDKVAVITWGKRQPMTRAFYEKYNDESWTFVTPAELHQDGTFFHGFNLTQLNAWLQQLAG